MSSVDPLRSELRVFLSIDIVQSLEFKNAKNYEDLRKSFVDKKNLLSILEGQSLIDLKGLKPDEGPHFFKAAFPKHSREDLDWAAVFERAFDDIHTVFASELRKVSREKAAATIDEALWKLQGDELVYSFEAESRRELHDYVIAFLTLIRQLDKEAVESRRQKPRVQGAAWVAGFPVRNRRVTFLERHRDWLGPDIDAGFRLAKSTHGGLMVISTELAELIGEMKDDIESVKGGIVGWKELKAVWGGKPYPIIWITLERQPYEQFSVWEEKADPLVREWTRLEENKELRSMSHMVTLIQKIREALPDSLGVVKPYIRPEDGPDKIPPAHRNILDILTLQKGIDGEQSTDGEPPIQGPSQGPDAVNEFADTYLKVT